MSNKTKQAAWAPNTGIDGLPVGISGGIQSGGSGEAKIHLRRTGDGTKAGEVARVDAENDVAEKMYASFHKTLEDELRDNVDVERLVRANGAQHDANAEVNRLTGEIAQLQQDRAKLIEDCPANLLAKLKDIDGKISVLNIEKSHCDEITASVTSARSKADQAIRAASIKAWHLEVSRLRLVQATLANRIAAAVANDVDEVIRIETAITRLNSDRAAIAVGRNHILKEGSAA